MRTYILSVLIWIQTVSLTLDCAPERILERDSFEKGSRRQQLHEKLPSMQRVNNEIAQLHGLEIEVDAVFTL